MASSFSSPLQLECEALQAAVTMSQIVDFGASLPVLPYGVRAVEISTPCIRRLVVIDSLLEDVSTFRTARADCAHAEDAGKMWMAHANLLIECLNVAVKEEFLILFGAEVIHCVVATTRGFRAYIKGPEEQEPQRRIPRAKTAWTSS